MPVNQIIRLVCLMICLLLLTTNSLAQDERAQKVLSQVRQAIGGETRIKATQSLFVSGTSKHVVRMPQEQVIEEKLELQFLLPDKFLRVRTVAPPGGFGEMTVTEGYDGNQAWTDVNSSGPDAMIFRADSSTEMKAQMAREKRTELARYLLTFLLMPPTSFPVEWSYFGKAESGDGRADVLDVKGDSLEARFFFDDETHLPLMVSYKTKMQMMMAVAAPLPSPEKKVKELKKAPSSKLEHPPLGEAKEVEIQVRLSDYREINGLKFPHHIVFLTGEQIDEEWENLNWKLNPKLSADKFQPRQKQ